MNILTIEATKTQIYKVLSAYIVSTFENASHMTDAMSILKYSSVLV